MNDAVTHVLVIDDDDLLRRSLADKLGDAGFKVADAHDGESGLQIALETHPQLIFLDQQMPGLSGIDMLKELRSDEWGKDVEVVFATNLYDPQIINEAIANGVHDYVLKADVTLEQIVELAKKYVPLES
jgi:CheY-like chemotaxis protein